MVPPSPPDIASGPGAAAPADRFAARPAGGGSPADRHAQLLVGMPSRARVASEALLAVGTVFLPGIVVTAWPGHVWESAAALTLGLLAWAGWLVRPWRSRGGGQLARVWAVAALLGVVASVVGTALAARPGPRARLGVLMADRDGQVEVTQVLEGTAAFGKLREQDRIVALAGEPLDGALPSSDLRRRLTDATGTPAGPTRLSVVREGESVEVEVTLPKVPSRSLLDASQLPWLVLRGVALIVLVLLLLWSDGQPLGLVGLRLSGLPREVLWSGPICVATWLVNSAVTVPLARLLPRSSLRGEANERLDALQGLTSGVSLWQFALLALALAAFEEVVFRGFLIARARWLFGRWWLALLATSAVFGAGHLYEGGLAVVQTAVLGVCFGVAYLWRKNLAAVVMAHALFNTSVFALMMALERTGLLDKVRSLR